MVLERNCHQGFTAPIVEKTPVVGLYQNMAGILCRYDLGGKKQDVHGRTLLCKSRQKVVDPLEQRSAGVGWIEGCPPAPSLTRGLWRYASEDFDFIAAGSLLTARSRRACLDPNGASKWLR